jgi:hypothetical protein
MNNHTSEPWEYKENCNNDSEPSEFEEIECLCGRSFTKMDFGDVQCPYCGQIWGI